MATSPPGLELRPLPLPASIHTPDAADFVEMVRVRNLVYREINGHADEDMPAGELLPTVRSNAYEDRLLWVAVLDGEVVGRVGVDIPLEDGSRIAYWRVEFLQAAWGRGIGAAAYELVERVAREHGRTVLQSWATHPHSPGPRITPPTGFGSVPHDHAARFYLRHGYALEQVERISALRLGDTDTRIAQLLAQATAASADYRVVQWMLPTPPEFVAGYGWMKSRMITDAPAAAIEYDQEVWDAARLAEHESQYLDAGRTMQVTAAQHITTGELVAFNELVIGGDLTMATFQEDTLVLKNHRGHRLGMLVKCAALISWRKIAPESPRVITYNAEENRPMLDINEAIGFEPIAYEGAWKKVLS